MIDMDTSNCYTRFGVVYVNVGENQASFARVFSFDSVYCFFASASLYFVCRFLWHFKVMAHLRHAYASRLMHLKSNVCCCETAIPDIG